jgi:SAM-dependent methyltransferase
VVQDNSKSSCRVCGSPLAVTVGSVEYYAGFCWPIFDCPTCGCRFTRHEDRVYEQLHADAGSSYSRYRELAAACKRPFDQRDLSALRVALSQVSKYKFVIDELAQLSKGGNILEIGCARGFLTSYFILGGWSITGVDISAEAIKAARANFGEHFALSDPPSLAGHGPYDAIYHVGTIGCVSDPVGLTRLLLKMLKPGGKLLFNAPNRAACWSREQLWFESAPPPDVVTLFPVGFWRKQFSGQARTDEQVEMRQADESLAIGLRRTFGRKWCKPVPLAMHESCKSFLPLPRFGDEAWRLFERAVIKMGRLSGLTRMASLQPTEYGLFVKMIAN